MLIWFCYLFVIIMIFTVQIDEIIIITGTLHYVVMFTIHSSVSDSKWIALICLRSELFQSNLHKNERIPWMWTRSVSLLLENFDIMSHIKLKFIKKKILFNKNEWKFISELNLPSQLKSMPWKCSKHSLFKWNARKFCLSIAGYEGNSVKSVYFHSVYQS